MSSSRYHIHKKISVFLFLMLLTVPGPVLATKAIGSVTSLEGGAYATMPGVKRALALNDEIFEKETLHTQKDSQLVVRFLDETILRMGENTSVALEQYNFDDTPGGLVGMFSRMLHGLVRMTTGKIVERDRDKFNFQTPLATLGIRGTEFYAETTADGEEIGVTALGPGHIVALNSSTDQTTINQSGFYVKVGPDGKFSPLMQISKDVSRRINRMQSTMTRMKMQRVPRHGMQ
jgi:hypothetical protein